MQVLSEISLLKDIFSRFKFPVPAKGNNFFDIDLFKAFKKFTACQGLFYFRAIHAPSPNPDKPERIATKAPRHKVKPLVNIHLCVFVSWWRKCFAIKCKEITTKTLIH
jgi:hypothetical protein